ncbi:MAG: radical SAM protein [Acidobacteriia bacterium]|nr:radical SAM protein [Terriglobia bacterium]
MKIISALHQLVDFVRRRIECRVAPREWMVETTNRCNLACGTCPRQAVDVPSQDMSFKFFEEVLDRHPEVEAVWPYGLGEPLLNPRISDFIRYAKRLGKIVSLSSNGTLLDFHRGEQLLDSGLDYLVLPVYGATSEKPEDKPYPSKFGDLETRIEAFLKRKLARGSPLHVTIQTIEQRNDPLKIRQFRRRWKQAGVDTIRVKDDLSGQTPNGSGPRRHKPDATRPCFFLWRGPLFVQAGGTIIPCPYYHGAGPFGDLHRQTALEAWNSEPMRRLRDAHLKGDLSQYPVCANCPRHQPHRLLASLGFFVTTGQIRRIFPKLEDVQRRFGWKLFE